MMVGEMVRYVSLELSFLQMINCAKHCNLSTTEQILKERKIELISHFLGPQLTRVFLHPGKNFDHYYYTMRLLTTTLLLTTITIP